MQGVIYTRVSSDEQVKGTSLEFQEQLCRKYCAERGIEVLEVFREQGESAKTADREEFLRALEYCRKHKARVEAFVVAKVDRFARNTEDHFFVRKRLLEYGVTLHSVTEPIGNSPTEKFVETVLAASSEFDNAIRRQRCMDGMVARLNQGIWPWKPPPGYRCLGTKKKGEKKSRPDPPDPDLFPILQRGLKEYAKGRVHSLSELARLLDGWGLADARGRSTRPQLVDRILGKHLTFYAGLLVNPWTGEEMPGLHEPMISETELRQIQAIRAGKARVVKRDRFNPLFPLRRVVRCGTCDRPLTGAVSRGNGGQYAYYECYNRSCVEARKAIPKDSLEGAFAVYLDRITPKEKCLGVFEEAVLDAYQEECRRSETHRERHAQRLAKLEARRRRICELREDGSYGRDTFRERLKAVDLEMATANARLAETHDEEEFPVEEALAGAVAFIRNLRIEWEALAPELQPRFGKLVFPEGISYMRDSGFRTARLSLILELSQDSHGSVSYGVHSVRNGSNQILEELRRWQKFLARLGDQTRLAA